MTPSRVPIYKSYVINIMPNKKKSRYRKSTMRVVRKTRGGSSAAPQNSIPQKLVGWGRNWIYGTARNVAANKTVQFAVAGAGAAAVEYLTDKGGKMIQTTSENLQKKAEKFINTEAEKTVQKILPKAHGQSNSDIGVLHGCSMQGVQEVAGREVTRHVIARKISAIHDKQMCAAYDLYGSQSVITEVQEPRFRGTLRFHSGFNCKGFAYPQTNFPALDNSAVPPSASVKLVADDGVKYPLAFTVRDYWNAMAQSTGGTLPNVSTSPGDVDIFYAFRSIKLETKITNTNAYYPASVKVYLLKAITEIGVNKTPCQQYFSDSLLSQIADKVNYKYIKHVTTTEATGNPNVTYISQVSMLPQVTPAMSPAFKNEYTIIAVDTKILAPSDSLDYTLIKEIPHVTSYREIDRHRRSQHSVMPNDYLLMVEFQGGMALANPTNMPISEGSLEGTSTPVEGLAPVRIRIDTKKSIDVSSSAINSTLNDVNTLEPDSQPTWLFQRNLATNIDSSVVTFNYFAQSKTPGATGTYALPVYTDEQKQYAGPQVDL